MTTYAPPGSTYGALGGTYANLMPIDPPTWVAFEGEGTITVATIEGSATVAATFEGRASLAPGALEGM